MVSEVTGAQEPKAVFASLPPCRTVYIRNLPEKMSKVRLRELLFASFSTFGKIVWISAEKSVKLRGQAFISFEDIESATNAVRKMHSTSFLDRVVVVQYAREESDKVCSDAPNAKRRRKAEKEAAKAVAKDSSDADAKDSKQGSDGSKMDIDANGRGMASAPAERDAVESAADDAPPNKIIFAQGVHESLVASSGEGLAKLFGRFSGFVEVRVVAGQRRIAFIEFASEQDAAVALAGLQGHAAGDPPETMKLTYAKR